MQNVKMVYGTNGKRKIASITRQQEIKQQLKEEWFTVDDSEKISFSDICMSVSVYLLMPIILILIFIYMIMFR